MTPRVFQPATLGPVQVRNRTVKAATFENRAAGGRVTDELIAFHRRHAAGGVGVTTVAYVSVAPEGRTYADQLVLTEAVLPGIAELASAVHDEGAALSLQIGHAGWFASPKVTGSKPVGPSRRFSPRALTWSRAATERDLDGLLRDFEAAARLAVRAGVDVLEVHLGHGYLLSQFLSPWTNRRTDRDGGDVEGRMRFPRRVLEAVRLGAGSEVAVTAKLNVEDGFRGGLTLDDGIEVARAIAADGSIDAIQPTVGFTGRNPMMLLRGASPLPGLAAAQERLPMKLVMKGAALTVGREVPFREAFLRERAERVRDAVDIEVMLLGGVTERATMVDAIDDGFGFVAMARALLHDPDIIRRYAAEEAATSGCDHRNECIVAMESEGAGCKLIGAPGEGIG